VPSFASSWRDVDFIGKNIGYCSLLLLLVLTDPASLNTYISDLFFPHSIIPY
jgi:hypothetical protein